VLQRLRYDLAQLVVRGDLDHSGDVHQAAHPST
jgi:hypothetical protein